MKWLIVLAMIMTPSLAVAQMVPSGQFTPGHTIRCQNSPCTVVVDGGGSAGSSVNGQGYLTEIGITNTGTPFCINDHLVSAASGYHQLCLGANALGGGLLSYNPIGGASPLNFQFNINGVTFEFPGTGNGNVVGPVTTTISDIACWANGSGTLLKDGALSSPCTAGVLSSTQLLNSVSNLVTTQPPPSGSLGEGAVYVNTVRTGGFGQYGNALFHYEETAALPSNQVDISLTGWITAQNLVGGQVFGGWMGANTPAKNLGQSYSTGAAIGAEIDYGNRWADFGLLFNVGQPQYTVGLQIVPDPVPATGSQNVANLTSFSTGSPAVFTLNNHGFYANMGVVFLGTAGITGLTDEQTYYVISTGLTSNQFEVSATIGGTAVNTTGGPSGTLQIVPSWPGSFGLVQSHSLHGHQVYVTNFVAPDTVAPTGFVNYIHGGSIAGGPPTAWTAVVGNFVEGLDMSGATFSSGVGIALPGSTNLNIGTTSFTGTSGGSVAISSGASGAESVLYANNFGVVALRWNNSGAAPTLGFYGHAVTGQPVGYGTPTNQSLTTNLPGTSATLSQVGGTLAQLILDLKSQGLLGP